MSSILSPDNFFAAIRFLTILPVGRSGEDVEQLRRSVPFFPVAGLLIGILCSVLLYYPLALLTGIVPSVLAVLIITGLSAGLHMDGLADTFDGFLSHTSRTRMMEIMKDSRVGAMGLLAVVFVVMIKVAAFSVLDRGQFLRIALLVPVAGRWAIVQQICFMPYMRESGLGSAFKQNSKIATSVLSSVFFGGLVFAVLGIHGLVCLGASAVALLVFSLWSRKAIGGATGDIYGAACEITETAFLLCAAFMLPAVG